MQEEITQLAGGVTVASERLDHVRSAAIGWFIDVGSAHEPPGEGGYAHLLEHMLFRGTPSYSSEQIDQRFDAIGGEINAGTGKDGTSVYVRVLDTHVEEAFRIGAEMVWQPLLTEADTAQEREIVLEEIAMYEDDPQELVFDLAAVSVFGDGPLGRPVIGTRETVSAATPDRLRHFHERSYRRGRIVVAGAGAIDHDELVTLTASAVAGLPEPALPNEGSSGAPAAVAPERSVAVVEKPTEQAHLVLSGPGLARDDERRFALRILDAIVGGSSSSRLFQEIREKRALAYAVYSFASFHEHAGHVGAYVGTRPDRLGETAAVLKSELDRLCSGGIGADELDRGRESVKGRTILAMESTSARMNRLGSTLQAGMPLLSLDEITGRLDAVTADDLAELANEIYVPSRMSVAAIAPLATAVRSAADELQRG